MFAKLKPSFVVNLIAVTTTEAVTADTGATEMDQSQNGEVIIGPQPDPSMSLQDQEMEEDEARSEATFRHTVVQFSKLKVIKVRLCSQLT